MVSLYLLLLFTIVRTLESILLTKFKCTTWHKLTIDTICWLVSKIV